MIVNKTPEYVDLPQTTHPPFKKISKFRASYLLATESLELLMQDKEILWFPVIAAFAGILLFIFFGFAIYYLSLIIGYDWSSESEQTPILWYVTFFIIYIIEAFILAFTGGAITHIVYTRIQGGDATFKDGWNAAMSNYVRLLYWSIINATVGMIIRLIIERSRWLTKIIISILGVTWSLITFFIVPTIMLENKSVHESIKESGSTFKQTWGETFISGFGIGLIFFALHVIGIVLTIAFWISFMSAELPAMAFVLLVSLYIFFIVVLAVIQSALQSVLKVVLYVYAKGGKIPNNFNPEILKGMVINKNR